MEPVTGLNYACICGTVAEEPRFSHCNRQTEFYKLPLVVKRLSGAEDTLSVILTRTMAEEISPGQRVKVEGQIRSYNNRSGVGNRLVISIHARMIEPWTGEDENVVLLTGSLCKQPLGRYTPLGRHICDLMVAVNRGYGKADYLPCIAWSDSARRASAMEVGDTISITGRLQSRDYIKNVEGQCLHRTAYEISILAFSQGE